MVVGIAYLKMQSTESAIITTAEFKVFQTSFLVGYSMMMLGELLTVASFYHTFTFLELTLEQITKLYIVTIVATTGFGVLVEIVDIGTRKSKSVLSALLYFIAMMSCFFGGHFDMLLMGRIVYGAASALHHSALEAYVVHKHATFGFPDEWLNLTFSRLTHCMALIAVLSGALGQTSSFSGPLGCVGLSCALFIIAAVYISFAWDRDMNGPRFLLSGFSFGMKQTMSALSSSRQVLLVLIISSLCESAIMIFTFYWAPWLTLMIIEEYHTVPYEIVFATYITASMLGNYIYQMYAGSVGLDQSLQIILFTTGASFFLGAIFQTPLMAFAISTGIQLVIGGYWPSIGMLRGRYVMPELRPTLLTLSR